LGWAATAFGGPTLVANSPFAPSGTVAGAAASNQEPYQLAGSSSEGSDVSVCIFLQQSKRSLWIPVGGEADGVHVISFDAAHDTAVVTAGGSRREISMRKSVIASAGQPASTRAPQVAVQPESAPAPIAAAAAGPGSEAAAKDQREARMLVSDLLEIGVQQRKAYQDAKAKAAAQPPQQ
jgi:hypothetical protein